MNYWIYLFGSFARNENDEFSDLDILLVYDSAEIPDLKIEHVIDLPKTPSISSYSVVSIKKYFLEGHLFAWHLYNEAILLRSNSNYSILQYLGPPEKYSKGNDDLEDFMKLFESIKKAVLFENFNLLFEAGNFYTFLRNFFFYYTYSKCDKMIFSPNYIYNLEYNIPISKKKFNIYRRIKHIRSEGSIIGIRSSLTKKDFINDVDKCSKWLKEINYGEFS